MSNKKITELPAKANPSSNDLISIVDVSAVPPATKRTTIGAIAAFGATGPAGTHGATGATGLRGLTGSAGVVGASGPVGSTGPRGVTGATGARGAGLNLTGDYFDNADYQLNDVVSFNGNSYVRVDLAGELDRDPAAYPAAWNLLAERGLPGATGATGPRGLTGAGGNSSYEFTVNYSGSSPSAVTNLPTGWTAVISSSDVTVTHNVNKVVKNVTYWGYTAGTNLWHARYPTASSELTVTESTKNTTFKIRISNTVVACDTGGTARIVCFF
jgi:hypothetical protein